MNTAFVLSFLWACGGRIGPEDDGPRGDATTLDVVRQGVVPDLQDAGRVEASDAAADHTFVAVRDGAADGDAVADVAGDASPCGTFQAQPLWTTTSASFDCSFGVPGDGCGSSDFQFSESARTLSGDACIGGGRSRWLVRLSQAQVDAIVAKAQAVQTVCEPNCLYALMVTRLSVQGAAADASATDYQDCFWSNSMPPIETDSGLQYMDVAKGQDLVNTLFTVLLAGCDPDAGGGDPAICVPLADDGGPLDAAGGD
jgi:hypothetical protein